MKTHAENREQRLSHLNDVFAAGSSCFFKAPVAGKLAEHKNKIVNLNENEIVPSGAY